MPLGQLPRQWWSAALEVLKFATRLPIAIVIVVAAVMGSWVAFWFVVRATVYIYERYLSYWWHR